jgi:hypothetical protein
LIWGLFDSWAQALEVAGVWLAAFATFLAAFVALHIANRSNRQCLNVTAGPMLEARVGDGPPKSMFFVTATNVGNRPATVTQLSAQSALRTSSFVIVTGTPGSTPLPATLKDGEVAYWRFPEILPDGKNWYADFASHFALQSRLLTWVSLKTLRFEVRTSLGYAFYSKPSAGFHNKVLDQMNKG